MLYVEYVCRTGTTQRQTNTGRTECDKMVCPAFTQHRPELDEWVFLCQKKHLHCCWMDEGAKRNEVEGLESIPTHWHTQTQTQWCFYAGVQKQVFLHLSLYTNPAERGRAFCSATAWTQYSVVSLCWTCNPTQSWKRGAGSGFGCYFSLICYQGLRHWKGTEGERERERRKE